MIDYTKAAIASPLNVDKVVFSQSGVYDSANDVTTVVHTIAGSPTNVYLYKIAHTVGRPTFVDILTSTDNVTFYDGGSTSGKIAFSDSSFIYILDAISSKGSGTIYYKVVASWIDNYDSTNPAINPFQNTTKKTLFDSRSNYQKILTQNVLNFSAGVFGAQESQPVSHSLGYQPNYRVFFEAFTGQVWPLNFGGASNPFNIDDAQNEGDAKITSTTLTVQVTKFGNNAVKAWYRIYIDS